MFKITYCVALAVAVHLATARLPSLLWNAVATWVVALAGAHDARDGASHPPP